MENKEEIVQGSVREADSVIKIICAIMNEEESVDAYEEKTPEEMVELLQSINNRFPNNDQASVDLFNSLIK